MNKEQPMQVEGKSRAEQVLEKLNTILEKVEEEGGGARKNMPHETLATSFDSDEHARGEDGDFVGELGVKKTFADELQETVFEMESLLSSLPEDAQKLAEGYLIRANIYLADFKARMATDHPPQELEVSPDAEL